MQKFCVTNRGQFKFTINDDYDIFLNGYYHDDEDSTVNTLKIYGAHIGADDLSNNQIFIKDYCDLNYKCCRKDFEQAYVITVILEDSSGDVAVWQNMLVIDDQSLVYFVTNVKPPIQKHTDILKEFESESKGYGTLE